MKPCDPCYWLFSFSTKQIAAEQSKIATSLFQPPIATKEECPQISETIEVILESLINSSSFKQFEAECHRILLNAFVDKCDDYLWISVVFFSMFMRCNFVGPFELTEHEMDEWDKWFKLELLSNDKQLTSVKCHQWLRTDNEDIEFELKYPFFLILASIILENGLSSNKNGNNSNKNEISWHWWYVRVLRYHQNILSNPCPTLQNNILSHCQSIQELFPQSFIKLKETKQEINNNTIITLKELLKCQFNVEYALIANFYWKHEIVKKQILSAKQCLSDAFVYKLTSKLGKRTKYQIQSKSQLYLLVNSSIYKFFPSADLDIDEKTEEKESGLAAQQKHYKKTWYLPLNVRLEDDTLLDEIRWDDEIHHFKLHYLEYCIILFEAVQQSVINKVRGISELCILAYLDGLNSNGNIHDWSVQLFVLLQRSRTEFRNYSKQSRAIQQYESIQYHLDSMFDESRFFPPQYTALKTHIKLHSNNNRDNRLNVEYNELCTDIAYKRLRGIYGTILKSNAQIQCELGDLYMSLGFTRSALAIYEKLNHFQKVAQCLVNLDRKHDAKQLLFQQIKQIDLMHANKQKNDGKVRICQHYSWDKKPYYLCLLGDICEDNAYYQQAWNVSHKTYGRAMRTLAYNHYHSQEYEECIECARNALAINSLFPKVWFLLGSASMQLKQPIYEYVIESFSFVVSIDDTDFEAWNNLGAAHMNLNNYKSALYALQQAGNLRRGNWKIWENILTCSLKLKKLSKSISSLSHLIDIKKDTTSVNPNIIAALTVELTAKIEKYQLQNTDIDITDPEQKNEVQIDETKADECGRELEEEELSKPTIISLMTQFDKLVLNILDRLSQHSFLSSSSHIKQSPFTKTGLLDNDNLLHGISENQRAKQTQSAYDIYEIFATYFEKCLRIEESVESRFKQCRIIMKYFEIISRQNAQINEKNKKEYLKIIHVLSRLTFLYSLQINGYRNSLKNEKGNLDINKLQQMLTSIQLLFNRLQKLSNKLYIDLKESKELTIKLEEMEELSYKIKNESITNEKESILSAFSDWM